MNSAIACLVFPIDEVVAVPFGVDTRRFAPPAVPRPETPPLRLICTRNFGHIYSVHTLVSALHEVGMRGLRLRVDLVGDGPLRRELEREVMRAGMRSWVSFCGHVDHANLAELLG